MDVLKLVTDYENRNNLKRRNGILLSLVLKTKRVTLKINTFQKRDFVSSY